MPTKEISELRKAGKLDEALAMAEAELQADSNGIWPKRNISWVYYDLLKQNTSIAGLSESERLLNKIKDLNLPENETLFFDQLAFQVAKLIFKCTGEQPVHIDRLLSIYELVRDMSFTRPSKGYTFLFKAFHKAFKDTDHYLAFADWWDFEHFNKEDYENEKTSEGREIMSIVEQAYIAYSKKLLPVQLPTGEERFDRSKIESFVPKLEKIASDHKKYQYPSFYLAKLYAALGDKQRMFECLKPFALRKSNDFWVWDLMSETCDDDPELVFACYCKALSCKGKEEMLVNLRQRMAAAMIARQQYDPAKFEIQQLVAARSSNNFKIPSEVLRWQDAPWFASATAPQSNQEFYLKYANDAEAVLYRDNPETPIIVDFVNKDKHMLNFIASEGHYGFFKYDRFLRNPKIGQTLMVRFQSGGEVGGRYNVLAARSAEIDEMKSRFLRTVNGAVRIQDGKAFGFLEDIYVPKQIIERLHLTNGSRIQGTAMKTYNKDKKSWAWKLIEATILV